MKIHTKKGYDVEVTKLQGEPTSKANGFLFIDKSSGGLPKGKKSFLNPASAPSKGTKGGRRLWVYEIQTGFSLSGTTGQSINARTFFPRNRVQQSITVLCQCPNQQNYAETVEWIRSTHKLRSTSVRLSITTYNMPVKGQSEPLLAEGYIKSVPRSHSRFEYAPELRFDFLVERILLPAAWKDELTKAELGGPRELPTWKDVIEKQGVFRRDPDGLDDDVLPIPAQNPGSRFHDSGPII